jgi:phage gp46-like protein
MALCQTLPTARVRPFWTYKQNSCGEALSPDPCGQAGCGLPGFQRNVVDGGGATIDTAARIVSMAIMILMTRQAVVSQACGNVPVGKGGYWGDSYRADNLKSGTRIYDVPTNLPIAQQVTLIQAYAQQDLQKLVALKEATDVTAKATYAGGGNVKLEVTLQFDGTSETFTATGSALSGAWTLGV